VVENFLPGVVAKLGCDYAALSAVKPDLVYCSISGFGQSGPLRLQPAFHHIVNAMSGIMHLEQQTDPAPRPGYLQAADVLAGTHAFGAILAALWRRTRTGRGAYLDVSMLECMVGAEDIHYGGILNAGPEYPGPRPGMIVHGLGGRHVAMQTVGAPQLWARLVAMMDRPDLASDARFATPAGRREHWAELHPIICTCRADSRLRRPLARRGRGPSPPGGAAGVSGDRASRAGHRAHHGRAVSRRQSAGEAARRRALSGRRAHARGARRGAGLFAGADRGATQAGNDRRGLTPATHRRLARQPFRRI